jgi:hypothetical protein
VLAELAKLVLRRIDHEASDGHISTSTDIKL